MCVTRKPVVPPMLRERAMKTNIRRRGLNLLRGLIGGGGEDDTGLVVVIVVLNRVCAWEGRKWVT